MDEMILAIVVTYYPEKELLINNVKSFIDDVDKVIIWENTPETEKLKYRFISDTKIEYCGDGINSISRALNYGWKYAQDSGYDYLLTMDQDSIMCNFESFKKAVIKKNKSELCIIGPLVNSYEIEPQSFIRFIRKEAIITSGTLISVNLLNQLNGYCELFQIDAIDNELCIKADSMGFKIYQYTNANLEQRFGKPSKINLGFRKIYRYNYSNSRLYEMFRNHIALYRKYKHSHWAKHILFLYFKSYFWGVLLFDNNKCLKMRSIFKGIKDGIMFDIEKL